MTDTSRQWGILLLAACLLVGGCAAEKKPEAPVVKIGAGSPAPPAAAPVNRAQPAAQPLVSTTTGTSRTDVAPKRRPNKAAESAGVDDEDLGAGESRFAALPATAVGGIHFVVAGADAEANVD